MFIMGLECLPSYSIIILSTVTTSNKMVYDNGKLVLE